MALEGKSEETQMAQIAKNEENELEPSIDVKEKGVDDTTNVKVTEENGELKKEDVPKTEEKKKEVEKGEAIAVAGGGAEEEKKKETETRDVSPSPAVEKNSSFREESSFLSDLKEHEKKARDVSPFPAIEKNSSFREESSFLSDFKEHEKKARDISPSPAIEKNSSFREESNFLSDLKEHEKKALIELKTLLEEAILANKLFKETNEQVEESEKAKRLGKEGEEKENDTVANEEKEEKTVKKDNKENENPKREGDGKGSSHTHVVVEEKLGDINRDVSLWGVPLLPSKGDKGTDVILLKFLRARDFKVNDAFEMLRNTLQWREKNNIDSILNEELGNNLGSMAYMNGVDREGHPICYNVYGVLENDEMYNKTFGTEEKRDNFLRWRVQLMEKGIQRLDFQSGGVSSLLQINDLKNTPGPSKKEIRMAAKQAVGLLQDNYPEFVSRNIFINVPFWYYAFIALLSPFFTQRTKNKFVFARPSKVTETLLKYIPGEKIPAQYGGLKRESDYEFATEDSVLEVIVKAKSTESIEIPTAEVGTTLIWDLTVSGWEVAYKEEFVPTNEGSYTLIIQKERKMGLQEGPVRNSFRNNEPGKVVLTVENGSFKKKRVLYRYRTKNSS